MDKGLTDSGRFTIPDYAVFFASLFASFAIGIYSSFAGKKKEKTTEDFYFGNHDMNIVAVAMSLAATFLSAIGLLGVPSEVYRNGISYSMLLISEFVAGIIAIAFFIPFFYNLRLTSVYEYFEHRFNRTIRKLACALFMINMMIYMSIVLYAPALALSQVSGLPIWVSILTSGLICTIYTSLGGMKAVIWTDAFQMVIMLIGVLIVLIRGGISAGGPAKIIEANFNTGRMNIPLSPDPTIRHSIWALTVGGIFTVLPFTLTQPTVQRYLSVKDKRAAQKMMSLQLPTVIIWWSILISIGAIMYAFYQGCDPSLTGRIETQDQMMAIFVSDVLGQWHGLPGLFTAVVYSATLSSVSSGVNSIVVVLTEDFIRPIHHLRTGKLLDEQVTMRLTKGLSFLTGFMAIGLAFVAKAMGRGLIQFCMSIDGMLGGPLLGLFFCGMMLPYCNSKGAAVGLLAGLIITFWIGIGAIVTEAPQFPLPLTADQCNGTDPVQFVNVSTVTGFFEKVESSMPTDQTIIETTSTVRQILTGVNWVYGISYQCYGLVGFFVTVTVATVVSFATGRQRSSQIPDRFLLYKLFSRKDEFPPEKIFNQFDHSSRFNAKLLTQVGEPLLRPSYTSAQRALP